MTEPQTTIESRDPLTWADVKLAESLTGGLGHADLVCPGCRRKDRMAVEVCADRGVLRLICRCKALVAEVLIAAALEPRPPCRNASPEGA